jgi:hypothetical protein
MPYKVLVDDNFHHTDESARGVYGSFVTAEEALDACKRMIDQELEEWHRSGVACEKLYETYRMFGHDPFVVADEGSVAFSAWDYAKARCDLLRPS